MTNLFAKDLCELCAAAKLLQGEGMPPTDSLAKWPVAMGRSAVDSVVGL